MCDNTLATSYKRFRILCTFFKWKNVLLHQLIPMKVETKFNQTIILPSILETTSKFCEFIECLNISVIINANFKIKLSFEIGIFSTNRKPILMKRLYLIAEGAMNDGIILCIKFIVKGHEICKQTKSQMTQNRSKSTCCEFSEIFCYRSENDDSNY